MSEAVNYEGRERWRLPYPEMVGGVVVPAAIEPAGTNGTVNAAVEAGSTGLESPRDDDDRQEVLRTISASFSGPSISNELSIWKRKLPERPASTSEDEVDFSDPRTMFRTGYKVLPEKAEKAYFNDIDNGIRAYYEFAKLSEDKDVDPAQRNHLTSLVERAAIAREVLFHTNIRLVVSVASSYINRVHGTTMGLEDLVQEGLIGLNRAIVKFDVNKNYKFSTYSTWWISQAISRAIDDKSRIIPLPSNVAAKQREINRAFAILAVELSRQPTDDEVLAYTKLKPVDLDTYHIYQPRPASLDKPVASQPGSESVLGDFVPAPGNEFDDSTRQLNNASIVKEIFGCSVLTEREKMILSLRYGLGPDGKAVDGLKPQTLDVIGQILGLTRERIRQIEAHSLTKALHYLRAINVEANLDNA